tara:strand:- start:18532 stop:19155 length:624 start_codon:yes stop_codon:yes gene_type:complete
MFLEQELKLTVNSDAQINLSTLLLPDHIIDGDKLVTRLVSTYFDTTELYLVSQKVGLRMRKSDEMWVQTVKTSGHVKDGLHQREEWEHKLHGAEWDLDKLKQTPLAPMIEDARLWSRIGPVFTTDFERETLQLRTKDGTQIELAYDRGNVMAGGLTQPIHEIELELKSGNVENLQALANELQQQLSLSPSNTSKAKMGYQLVNKRRV